MNDFFFFFWHLEWVRERALLLSFRKWRLFRCYSYDLFHLSFLCVVLLYFISDLKRKSISFGGYMMQNCARKAKFSKAIYCAWALLSFFLVSFFFWRLCLTFICPQLSCTDFLLWRAHMSLFLFLGIVVFKNNNHMNKFNKLCNWILRFSVTSFCESCFLQENKLYLHCCTNPCGKICFHWVTGILAKDALKFLDAPISSV